MPTKKKSWTEKLADSKGLPKVEKITEKIEIENCDCLHLYDESFDT